METKILDFTSHLLIDEIRQGQVVSFPTETVYGLGVIFDLEDAFERLVKVKNRRPDKPFTLMLSSKEEVKQYGYVNDKIQKVINEFMPGEITLLIKPKENLFPWVTLNSKYIGIRVSGKKEVCQMIKEVGKPMLVTSANISSQPAAINFEETYKIFNGKIPTIVKGNTSSNTPSTIVICDDSLSLVREGNISFDQIIKVWEE